MYKIRLAIAFAIVFGCAFALGSWYGPHKPSSGPEALPVLALQDTQLANTSAETAMAECPEVVQPSADSNESAPELQCETAKQGLEKQIDSLLKRIEKQDQEIVFTNERFHGAIQALKKANVPLPEAISLEQASKLVSAPFDKVIAGGNPAITDKFNRLLNLPDDFDWGVIMQQQISDHFTTHQVGYLVSLDSVNCRKDVCEIRGFEELQGTWNQIMESMVATTWWNATSTNTVSGNSSDHGAYFYVIAGFPQLD